MAVRVIEFKSQEEYSGWLQRMGNGIRVLNVSTTKRWSFMTGFLGDAKTYTVTYDYNPAPVVRSQAAPRPVSEIEREVEKSLAGLKDKLLRLELRRQAGSISDEDYAQERAQIDAILRALVRG